MKKALALIALFASLMAGRAQDFGLTQTFLTDVQIVPGMPFMEMNLDSSFGVGEEMINIPSFDGFTIPAGGSVSAPLPGDGSSVSTVPEPSTIALAGLGAVVVGARFWRRR